MSSPVSSSTCTTYFSFCRIGIAELGGRTRAGSGHARRPPDPDPPLPQPKAAAAEGPRGGARAARTSRTAHCASVSSLESLPRGKPQPASTVQR